MIWRPGGYVLRLTEQVLHRRVDLIFGQIAVIVGGSFAVMLLQTQAAR